MRRIAKLGKQLQNQLDDSIFSSTTNYPNFTLFTATSAGSERFRPKTNQDAFAHNENSICLCDGHGKSGEVVSRLVSEQLVISSKEDIQRIQKQIFDTMGPVASMSSGCSAVWVSLQENGQVMISNIGDSRCVVVGKPDHQIVFETRDHKPDDPIELDRIHALGGKVYQMKNDVPRVAGLALSRAFGDFASKGWVTCEPDVTILNSASMCILGTDGVFDVCSSEEVVDFVCKQLGEGEDLQQRVTDLVALCKDRWRQESLGQYSDDVTCVICKINKLS